MLRGSVEAGTFEEMFFAAPAPGETDRLLRMARAALDAGRRLKRAARVEGRALSAAERSVAALTEGAVRVYEELLTLARLNRGRVYPSYDRLAEATALGRATVARALHLLDEAGFLLRQRRFKRVEGEGPGPRYEQTSNAYRPTLPSRILGLLPRRLRPAPLPDDLVQQEADRQEAVAAMRATLTCRELAAVTVGGALGRVLARLGAQIDLNERESHNEPQPPSHSYKTDKGSWPSRPTLAAWRPGETTNLHKFHKPSTRGEAQAPAIAVACSLEGASGPGADPHERRGCGKGEGGVLLASALDCRPVDT